MLQQGVAKSLLSVTTTSGLCASGHELFHELSATMTLARLTCVFLTLGFQFIVDSPVLWWPVRGKLDSSSASERALAERLRHRLVKVEADRDQSTKPR